VRCVFPKDKARAVAGWWGGGLLLRSKLGRWSVKDNGAKRRVPLYFLYPFPLFLTNVGMECQICFGNWCFGGVFLSLFSLPLGVPIFHGHSRTVSELLCLSIRHQ